MSNKRRKDVEKRINNLLEASGRRDMTPAESDDIAMLCETILIATDEIKGALADPSKAVFVWHAIWDEHEKHVWPCATEELAYELLANKAIEMREDIPEGWTIEETVHNWHELSGDEYMRVEGPFEIYRG